MMRSLLAGLLVALIIAAVALVVAAVGALGVAAIGLLLHHWFDLTQWQGTLTALVVTLGLGYLVYKLAAQTQVAPAWSPEWDDWDENDEDNEWEEDILPEKEPPVVPWRRSRPTPGDLPKDKPVTGSGKRK